MHTNYRLFVLFESDAVMLILSAGQQLLTLPDLYDEVRRGNAAIGSHRERSAQLQYIYIAGGISVHPAGR